jgi:hypothetical protein
MIETYREKLIEIDKRAREIEKEREKIISEMKSNGLYLDTDGNIKLNKETYGLFWNISYCAYYVGEHGMYTTEATGATSIQESDAKKLKQAMKEKKYDEAAEIISAYTPIEDYIIENTVENGKVTENDKKWEWVTKDKGYNDGDMNPGSKFSIRKTSLWEIQEIENYYEEDVAP